MAVSTSHSIDSGLLAIVSKQLIESPLSSVLALIVLICLLTRIRTEIQSKQQSKSQEEPKEPAVLPYWIPWLGHAIPFATRFQNFLADASKSSKDGVFHCILVGTAHYVVTIPSVTKQILLQRTSTLTTEPFAYALMEKFFGNKGGIRNMDPSILWGQLHQVLYQANREPFVSNAAAITVKAVQERTYNLISFSSSWVDQTAWERVADVEIDPSGTSATANLFPLLRHFVGDIASTVLMGQDFMSNNPEILSDLYTFDGSFAKLFTGFPWWLPGMASAYRARRRVVQAVREHQEALYAVWEDRDPGSRWSDLSDVSGLMQNRAREWRKVRSDPDDYSAGDTAVLWAMNANANQIIFWALWHIYQRPHLHSAILAEISPYATLTPDPSTATLPIPAPPVLTIDLPALLTHCPLLKATYFETMRLESPSTSYKAVRESFTITESLEDARRLGKERPQTYRFKSGSYVCVAHGVHAKDGRFWKDPDVFEPRRFFVEVGEGEDKEGDEKGVEKEKVKVDMGTMTPFGGGITMCKGRNFAEREVLVFVAAVLTVWDVEPVDGDGRWRNPGRRSASSAYIPNRDVRVRLRRRKVGGE